MRVISNSFAPTKTLRVKVRAIGAHHIQRKQISVWIAGCSLRFQEDVSAGFAGRAWRIVTQKESADSRRNRCVVEHAVNYRSFRNPRRDQNRRDADAEAIELKWCSCPGGIPIGSEDVFRATRWRHVVKDPSVFVIGDEQGSALPKFGIVLDRLVDGRDENLARLNVMIRVLVVGDLFPAIALMVAVIRLDERIVRQIAFLAVGKKLAVSSEKLRLILQQVGHLHGGAGRVVVIHFGGSFGIGVDQSRVDALDRFRGINRIEINASERSSVVGEGTIANRGPRNGSEPAVEYCELKREGG